PILRRSCIALALLGLAGAARAQTAPPVSAALVEQARAAYELGLRSIAEGRFHEAAVALERSNQLRPLPVVTYNLALAYRGLGRYVTAIAAFERYGLAPEPSVPPERLAAIREEVADLRRQLVTVRVRVTPPDAAMLVDGRPAAAPAPGEELALDPGAHAFEWTTPGFRPERRELPAAEASARVSLEVVLAPIRDGRLVVEPTPATASVTLDGRPLGAGRRELPLPPGEYWVEVSAPGFVPARRAVMVGHAGVARLAIGLVREPNHWLLPLLLGTGAAAVGAVITAVVVTRPEVPAPHRGTWGDVAEPAGP
ncbi:MAG: hypothetical protein JWM10_2088, partial [Myxococcaceae bacterium]|nr:hypothetical protein [Myxococcaceae bacterium]